MTIRKKSKEELQKQAEGFLDYANETGKIKEKHRRKISKILGLNESGKKGFLERLLKKSGKEINISDKGEIEKTLKKKHIDFDMMLKEYTKYLHKKSVDKHNDEIKQKVEAFFEPYKTPDEKVNDKIINIIAENYSKDTLEKARLFLESKYLEIFLDKKSFEYYILGNINFDNLEFMLDNFKIGELEIIRKSPCEMIRTDNATGAEESIYYNICEYEIDTIKENVLLLKRNGFNYKNFNLNELKDENIKKYVEIIDNCDLEGFRRDFAPEGENPELKDIILGYRNLTKENMLKECIATGYDEIDRALSKTPTINYENNGGYTSKYVHMFGGDGDNNIKMADYLGGRQDSYIYSHYHYNISDYGFLAFLWTLYWTNNWKKNINLMFNKGCLGIKGIKSYDEYIYGERGNNREIAILKLIDNDILKLLAKDIKSQDDFKVLLDLYIHTKPENLKIIFEKYPDIQISELTSLENKNTHILYYAKPENLNKIFERYPDIQISELTLLENENTHILGSVELENLKIIFEKYPKIKIEELINIKDILTGVKYTKIFKLVFEKYENITIDELNSLGEVLIGMMMSNWMQLHKRYNDIDMETIKDLKDILSEKTSLDNLKLVFDKYPDITVQELVRFSNIVNRQSTSALKEIINFGNVVPSSKSLNILDLFNDNTSVHNEVFEKIENKDEINDDNWIDITGLYSVNEYFEDDKSIPEEIKVKIRELLQSDESKDFIYRKLSGLLKKSLDDNYELTNEEIALLAVLNKKGLWNMGQSESLAKFIYQINKLDKNYKFDKAFTEIRGGINKFITSHKKDSNELINSFYQVSTSLLKRSPAIYRNVVKLLNKLDSKEQEVFYKEIFPLYNVELFLGEKSEQYELLGKKINNNVEGQLVPMHERIKILLNKLETDKQIDMNSLLLEEKSYLVENIKQLFKEKFGIKKIPTEFSKENIESIRWHSIYLSNMNNRDEEKSAVLGYFLALKLNGKRREFRTGKDFDPSEYMEDSKVYVLREYLSKRSERNSLYKLENIEEGDKLILQENESNTIIGNTNGITDRLHTIESNIKTLLDDDAYSEKQKIIKKYVDKDLGKLLAKEFQLLSGKNISISDEEKQILLAISNELGEDLTDIKNIQKLQNECKPISAILNFVNKILNENLPKEIQDFENLCKPSNEHLKLLKKIGVNLEDDSIVSSNSYLTYVESGIRKGKNKLTKEEYDSLNEYIIRVNKELDDLYGIKDKLTILYEDFKNKIIDKYFADTELKKRFESMSPYFFTKADVEKENIISLMTNDLDIVIKNIRQCLGCKDKGCNNDTDLSFGCDDRFFITTSHREGDTSFADELVTLLPRSPKEEGFTFVMDRIYGNNGSTDILLNNIYVILKKINKLSPDLRKQLSIFIPNNIGLTLNEEGISKLKKKNTGIDIDNQEITVTIEEQPITDSYHEFGGIGCRSTGDATISGYLIKIK